MQTSCIPRTPRLCKLSLHLCWGLDSKPCGCTAILDKMEGEPCECPTMEDRSCMRVTILDGPVCMGAAILDDGSCESSAILELG